MIRNLVHVLVLAALLFVLAGCQSAPYTGRSRLMLTSESEEIAMGADAWSQVLAEEKVTTEARYVQPVARVANAIIKVANRPDFQWEFKVLSSDTANAFCLPGGKIAVYTGLFRFTANEAELACVVAHEIGHAIARHGGEQVSREAMLAAGASLLSMATDSNAIAVVYGLAGEAGVRLPYSRTNEYEADHIGILLMAEAGYNPEACVSFWKKFGAGGSDSRLAEWLSTHPSGTNRIAELTKLLPEARAAYEKAPTKYNLGNPITP